MGNRWQFMFAVGEVIAIAVVTVLLWTGIGHEYLWRIVLGLSAAPANVLFIMRVRLPETVVWLVARGRFRLPKNIDGYRGDHEFDDEGAAVAVSG